VEETIPRENGLSEESGPNVSQTVKINSAPRWNRKYTS